MSTPNANVCCFNPAVIGAREQIFNEAASGAQPQTDLSEYAVEPLDEEHEGWFPKGEVSLVGGSSGIGKTTFMIPILNRIRRGEMVYGHNTTPREFAVLMHDRSQKSFMRTIRRMRLTKDIQRFVQRLTPEQQKKEAVEVIVEMLSKPALFVKSGAATNFYQNQPRL